MVMINYAIFAFKLFNDFLKNIKKDVAPPHYKVVTYLKKKRKSAKPLISKKPLISWLDKSDTKTDLMASGSRN